MFEKLVWRSGAIYSGMVAAGTVSSPVCSAAADADLAIIDTTVEAATAVEPEA